MPGRKLQTLKFIPVHYFKCRNIMSLTENYFILNKEIEKQQKI